jgi:hypothetical protein
MKTFNEILNENDKAIFEGIDVSFLTETELNEAILVYHKMNAIVEQDGFQELEIKIKEGLLGSLAGFVVGPAIGKVIARALGIERGILYDMFTSRLVGAALGSAIQNNMGK